MELCIGDQHSGLRHPCLFLSLFHYHTVKKRLIKDKLNLILCQLQANSEAFVLLLLRDLVAGFSLQPAVHFVWGSCDFRHTSLVLFPIYLRTFIIFMCYISRWFLVQNHFPFLLGVFFSLWCFLCLTWHARQIKTCLALITCMHSTCYVHHCCFWDEVSLKCQLGWNLLCRAD